MRRCWAARAPRDCDGGACVVARSDGRRCDGLPGGVDLVRLRKMPVDLDGRSNPLALLDGARSCALNGNVVDDRRRFRRLALHAGTYRAQGTGAKLAGVHARSGRGVRDRRRQRPGLDHALDHGNPAGRADPASRVEFHSQRRDLRRVLSQSGRRWRGRRLCRDVGADRRRGSGRDPARDSRRLRVTSWCASAMPARDGRTVRRAG